MKVCIIDNNNIFVNTQLIDPMKALPIGTTITDEPIMPNGMFAKWVDKEWIIINEYPSEPTPTIEVPQMLTPRQARLALLAVGLLDEVETLLANDKAMQIWWEYSLDIQRNHEHIVVMGAALGLTELQLDNLFIEGAKL